MISFNRIAQSGLILLLISCTNQSNTSKGNDSGSNAKAEDSLELSPNTFAYFKEILRQEKLVVADDMQMLSITDSLFSDDEINQGFYFLVFTKSMNGADGFYSEAVGSSAFKYITTKTERFVHNFGSIHELNDQDLDNWADNILSEIQIRDEKQSLKNVIALEKLLLERIDLNKKRHVRLIEQLITRMKSTAHNKS